MNDGNDGVNAEGGSVMAAMRARGSRISIRCLLRAGLAGLALVAASSAMGCVVNEAESPARGVVVSGPPPAPVREERPAPPGPQAAWVSGYWHWTGTQYAWIPGHWDAPPPGATWNAPVYTVREGRYIYETGGWRRGADTKNALR